jgi:2-aminoadipate transaminase
MLPSMTTKPVTGFDELLSTRARIGWDAPPPPSRPALNALYEFGSGYPDPATYPYDGLVEATARMMKEEGAQALNYGETQGYRALREVVCHKYALFERLEVTPENLIVSNGSGHALALAFSAFCDIGDVIISEAPTFSGTLNTIRRHGPQVLDAPVDSEGMVTSVVREHLEDLKKQGRKCKLIYTIVNFHNPSGPTMSLKRRQELIALAHEYDTLLLEDDAYGEIRFEGEPLPSLYALDPNGRVIRAGTVSKILGAGFRLGWLCAPKAMIPVFQGFLFGGGVNPFASRVATYFLRDHMAEHVGVLVEAYRAKRDAMLKGLWEVLGKTGRRDQQARGRLLHLDQAAHGHRPEAPRRDRHPRAAAVHAGPELLRQWRRRALHPPRLQLRVTAALLRGLPSHRRGDPGGKPLAAGAHCSEANHALAAGG